MTAPVSDAQVVVDKFLGVMVFYTALLATTLLLLVLMAIFGQPDPGVVIMGYLGMILLGAVYVAAGMFASTLTGYQLVAAITGAAICATIALLPPFAVAHAGEPWNRLAAGYSATNYLADFARGVFDTRGAVFFVSVAAAFLYLSVKTLESMRWR